MPRPQQRPPGAFLALAAFDRCQDVLLFPHIDARELKAAMRALGHEVTKQMCHAMFREVDKDPETALNFDDFCKITLDSDVDCYDFLANATDDSVT